MAPKPVSKKSSTNQPKKGNTSKNSDRVSPQRIKDWRSYHDHLGNFTDPQFGEQAANWDKVNDVDSCMEFLKNTTYRSFLTTNPVDKSFILIHNIQIYENNKCIGLVGRNPSSVQTLEFFITNEIVDINPPTPMATNDTSTTLLQKGDDGDFTIIDQDIAVDADASAKPVPRSPIKSLIWLPPIFVGALLSKNQHPISISLLDDICKDMESFHLATVEDDSRQKVAYYKDMQKIVVQIRTFMEDTIDNLFPHVNLRTVFNTEIVEQFQQRLPKLSSQNPTTSKNPAQQDTAGFSQYTGDKYSERTRSDIQNDNDVDNTIPQSHSQLSRNDSDHNPKNRHQYSKNDSDQPIPQHRHQNSRNDSDQTSTNDQTYYQYDQDQYNDQQDLSDNEQSDLNIYESYTSHDSNSESSGSSSSSSGYSHRKRKKHRQNRHPKQNAKSRHSRQRTKKRSPKAPDHYHNNKYQYPDDTSYDDYHPKRASASGRGQDFIKHYDGNYQLSSNENYNKNEAQSHRRDHHRYDDNRYNNNDSYTQNNHYYSDSDQSDYHHHPSNNDRRNSHNTIRRSNTSRHKDGRSNNNNHNYDPYHSHGYDSRQQRHHSNTHLPVRRALWDVSNINNRSNRIPSDELLSKQLKYFDKLSPSCQNAIILGSLIYPNDKPPNLPTT